MQSPRLARSRALSTARCRNSDYSHRACRSCAGQPVDGFQTCLPLAPVQTALYEWQPETFLATPARARWLSAKSQHTSLRGEVVPLCRHSGASFRRYAATPVAPGIPSRSRCWRDPTHYLCNSEWGLNSGVQDREGFWARPVRYRLTIGRKPNHICRSHLV